MARAARSIAVEQSPLVGFGRVAALELPDCRPRLIDLDPAAAQSLPRRGGCSHWQTSCSPQAPARSRLSQRPAFCRSACPPLIGRIASSTQAAARLAIPTGPFQLRITQAGSFDALEVCAGRSRAARAGAGRNRGPCDRPQFQRRAESARPLPRNQGRDRAAGHRSLRRRHRGGRGREPIQGRRRSVRRRAVCVCIARPHGRVCARSKAEVDRPRCGLHDSDYVPHRLLRSWFGSPRCNRASGC